MYEKAKENSRVASRARFPPFPWTSRCECHPNCCLGSLSNRKTFMRELIHVDSNSLAELLFLHQCLCLGASSI